MCIKLFVFIVLVQLCTYMIPLSVNQIQIPCFNIQQSFVINEVKNSNNCLEKEGLHIPILPF